MDRVSVESFRAALGYYLDQAYFRRESFVVTRNGIPFVVLAPVPRNFESPSFVSAGNLRKNTSLFLGRVHFESTELLVMRRNTPTAVLTNYHPGGENDLFETERNKK